MNLPPRVPPPPPPDGGPTPVVGKIPSKTTSAYPPQELPSPDPKNSNDWVVKKVDTFWKEIEKVKVNPEEITPPNPPETIRNIGYAIETIRKAVPGFNKHAYTVAIKSASQMMEAFTTAVEIAVGSGIAASKRAGYVVDIIKPSEHAEYDYDFTELRSLTKEIVGTALRLGDQYVTNTVVPALGEATQIAAQEILFTLLRQTRDMIPAILKIYDESTKPTKIPFREAYHIPPYEPPIPTQKTPLIPFDWGEASRRARDKANERFEKSPVSPLENKTKVKALKPMDQQYVRTWAGIVDFISKNRPSNEALTTAGIVTTGVLLTGVTSIDDVSKLWDLLFDGIK